MEFTNYRTEYLYLGPAYGESKAIIAELTPFFEDYLRKIDYQFFDLHFFHAIEFSMSFGGYRICVVDRGDLNLMNNVGPSFVKLTKEEKEKFFSKVSEELTNSDINKIIRFDSGRHSFKYLEKSEDKVLISSDYEIDIEEIFDLIDMNPVCKAKIVNDNRWVEGTVSFGSEYGYIRDFDGNRYMIQDGTDCGFSGHLDKNNNKIFVGDITSKGEVFSYGDWRLAYFIDEKDGKMKRLADTNRFDIEVIGNIHDK